MDDNIDSRFHHDRNFAEKPIPLEKLLLVQTGEICLEPKSVIPAHNQVCHEISFIISGNGYFVQNGERLRVGRGDIIITPDSGAHLIEAGADEPLFFAYIGFDFIDGAMPEDVVKAYSFKTQRRIGNCDIYNYFRSCTDEFYRHDGFDSLLAESYLIQIIILTQRLADGKASADYGTDPDNTDRLVLRIMRYTENNIGSPLTVSGISSAMGYSQYYISHTFSKKTGITLRDYIADRKLEKARELMALDRFTLSEISERLGYLNPQSFTRVYKRKYGVAPSKSFC